MRSSIVLWVDPYTKAVHEEWVPGARKLIVPRLTYARANLRARRYLGMPPVNPFAETIDLGEVQHG